MAMRHGLNLEEGEEAGEEEHWVEEEAGSDDLLQQVCQMRPFPVEQNYNTSKPVRVLGLSKLKGKEANPFS